MTYVITITGAKSPANVLEDGAFEECVAELARRFVAELEGVKAARITGGAIGTVTLEVKR